MHYHNSDFRRAPPVLQGEGSRVKIMFFRGHRYHWLSDGVRAIFSQVGSGQDFCWSCLATLQCIQRMLQRITSEDVRGAWCSGASRLCPPQLPSAHRESLAAPHANSLPRKSSRRSACASNVNDDNINHNDNNITATTTTTTTTINNDNDNNNDNTTNNNDHTNTNKYEHNNTTIIITK